MILFLNDWNKYPSAIVHNSTKNDSFIQLAYKYRKMGIKNHLFILALINPELEFVDPHSDKLTVEEMVKIGIECRLNPWYYLREVARAAALAGSQTNMAIANRGLIGTYWLYLNHITNILIQPRQTGKTFGFGTLINLLLHISGQNSNTIFFTKDSGVRADMMDKVRDLEEALPPYLNRRDHNDVSNTEEIKISALNNKLTGVISNASEKIAIKAARGFTAPNFFIDEAAFIPNIKLALPAALAAGIAAMDAAERNQSPHGTILGTTAGKLDDKDGAYVFRLLQNSLVWTEKLLDAENLEDLREIISKNNRGEVRINMTMSHRQLGYTDEWLKRKMQAALAEGQDAERDFLNKWTSGNIRSPLSVEVLNMIKESRKDPIYTEVTDKSYILNWYINENEINDKLNSDPTVMGLDTSDASGGDDIAMVIRDICSGAIICSATFNETYIIDFCVWLCDFLVSHKKVTAIIERRSTGATILDHLLKMLPNYDQDPYARLFNRVVNDRDEDIERFRMVTQPLYRKDLSMLLGHKKHFGFATSGSGITSRSDLYNITLHDATKKTGSGVNDSKLINEIAGLVIKNGRVDHESGSHDDLVIAWLLSHWLITQGQNLSVYGIDPSKVLINNSYSPNNNKEQSQYNIDHDLNLKKEIDSLLDKIKNCNDENLSYIYEKQVKYMSNRIKSLDFLSTLSIDDLLNKIKDQKKQKNNANLNKFSSQYGNRYNQNYNAYESRSYLLGNSRM